jgi:hypothetical protein
MSRPLSILIVDEEEEMANLLAEFVRTIGLDADLLLILCKHWNALKITLIIFH